MKTLNIFAILFIVSIVNTNKVTYSDVAQSLLQLHDSPNDAAANLQALRESFADSHKHLDNVVSVNQDTCKRLVAMNSRIAHGLAMRERRAKAGIANQNKRIASSQNSIKYTNSLQERQQRKVADALAEIQKEHANFAKAEAQILETVNILHRLENVARDELAGKTKITTEMGNYSVVNKHGVSFIQRSNMKEELKSLLARSETEGKSLISSLIMMTLTDDAHYSDPKIVRKILGVLNKIIAKNESKRRSLQGRLRRNTRIQSSIVSNGARIIANLESSKIRANEQIETSNRMIDMMNREIEVLGRAGQRREGRAKFQADWCAKQSAMMDTYQKRYAEVARRINDMRAGMQ